MAKRSISVSFLAACTLLIEASAAMAAGDPTKIGDNVKGILQPNGKSFLWIALFFGVMVLVLTRNMNKVGPFFAVILVAGIIVYNPAGVADMINNIAHKVL